jgi:GDPmannose 4,6-dehydratase
MQLMLDQDSPEDYVVGTGVTHSVEDLVSRAFAAAGLNWRDHVVCDTTFIRPAEPEICARMRLRRRKIWAGRPS